MKIAVINTYDSKDIKVWAGIPYHLSLMLEDTFGKDSVSYVTLPFTRHKLSYLRGFYYNRVVGKKYLSWTDKSIIEKNKIDNKELLSEHYDLIITFEFFLIPILKKADNKVVYWNDATFKNLVNFYPYVTNVSKYSLNHGNEVQRQAFRLSDAIVFTSDWAINSAIKDYDTDPRKLNKIYFASNLSRAGADTEVKEAVEARTGEVIKLLFLALNWERKGGDDAVELVDKLNAAGIRTLLYLVGDEVPERFRHNRNIVTFGFINKNQSGGEEKLIGLLKECSYLLLPTKADCTPVAFSEANSFGLPIISTNVGGIPSVVTSRNGFTSRGDFTEDAFKFIIQNLPGTRTYTELCYSSYKFYKDELSWGQVYTKFRQVLKDLSFLSEEDAAAKAVKN
ncbi:glycosyltransferase family 4 protein [Desertivirga brevis]|uniref:glycosyltransferase family 4 protein n=1 Tax=Desertivirga brevis TaxID=2810310 RepID=UPI001A97900A|nr:glycosyltransferase family 4 protein [Pedobacter sp. SYSU D00873]